MLKKPLNRCEECLGLNETSGKYCSDYCYEHRYRPYKYKTCLTCKREFITMGSREYCRPYHNPKVRKILKRFSAIKKCEYQGISKFYKEQIMEIYENCPKRNHIDHIIPLTHKLVCGLHVPWNLQYLPAAENIRKSNNWELSHA